MKGVIAFLLIITCVCTITFSSLSGVDLGNKVVGNDSVIVGTINTIKPLVDTAKFLYDCVMWLVNGIIKIWNAIVKFFGGEVKPTPAELEEWEKNHPYHEYGSPCPVSCPSYLPVGGGGGGPW